MAEIRNLFTGSKMNKDLDERLLPSGEYRDGQNISVSKSEGPNEGVVENILGNSQYSNFNFVPGTEIIGYYIDTNLDRIFIFATNYSDSTSSQLQGTPIGDTPSPAGGNITGSKCYIAYIQGPLASGVPSGEIIVEGVFLNFSKTHPMYGVDLIEDLLFFTDNRNQPRKINVDTAIGDPSYYFNEDHISVAKFAPYDTISFIDPVSKLPTAKSTKSKYLPGNALSSVKVGAGDVWNGSSLLLEHCQSDVFPIDQNVNPTRFMNLNKPDLGYFVIRSVNNIAGVCVGGGFNAINFEYPEGSGQTGILAKNSAYRAAGNFYGSGQTGGVANESEPFEDNDVLMFEQGNPEYEVNFGGDENYLKDKFVRFSYRFKYDDNEYSLMAPFTQPLFIPSQYGYFLDSAYNGTKTKRDEKITAQSGVVKFMENQVTKADMIIKLPPRFDKSLSLPDEGYRVLQSNFANQFKVDQLQILAKESTSNAIRVVEEINVQDNFTSNTLSHFVYNYVSNKPYKILPEKVSLRIHDKVPIKAAAQATAGNRIIYGNFVEKHASPESLNYNLSVGSKLPDGDPTEFDPAKSRIRKEYINHTVKQNRSYKVGIVLVDRYGRNSNVILRDESVETVTPGESSSLYSRYENFQNLLIWPGNSIKCVFNDVIPDIRTQDGYPGVWSSSNVLGYLSYKVVVQQKEQEYYNVLTPGSTAGRIVLDGALGSSTDPSLGLNYNDSASVSNIVLFGDNINKVPKELKDVGPTESVFGSETLLYPRVVTQYISNPTNYGGWDYNPVNENWLPATALSESSQVSFYSELTVNSILSFKDLGDWVSQKNLYGANSSYPNNGTKWFDPLYLGASANPFVAQLETSFLIGYSPSRQAQPNFFGDKTFSNNLNIFETNPVKSELDIYWESSTSGSIEELNKSINDGQISGIGINIGTPTQPPQAVSFTFSEQTIENTQICNEFAIIDSNGNLLVSTDPDAIEIVNITRGNGSPVTPATSAFFKIVPTTPGRYVVKTGDENATTPTDGYQIQWYSSGSTDNEFNITFRIRVNGDNQVTKMAPMSNSAPYIAGDIKPWCATANPTLQNAALSSNKDTCLGGSPDLILPYMWKWSAGSQGNVGPGNGSSQSPWRCLTDRGDYSVPSGSRWYYARSNLTGTICGTIYLNNNVTQTPPRQKYTNIENNDPPQGQNRDYRCWAFNGAAPLADPNNVNGRAFAIQHEQLELEYLGTKRRVCNNDGTSTSDQINNPSWGRYQRLDGSSTPAGGSFVGIGEWNISPDAYVDRELEKCVTITGPSTAQFTSPPYFQPSASSTKEFSYNTMGAGIDPGAYHIYMGPFTNAGAGSTHSDLANFWRYFFPLAPGSIQGDSGYDIKQTSQPSSNNCAVVKSEFRLRDSNGQTGTRDQIYSIIYLLFRTPS